MTLLRRFLFFYRFRFWPCIKFARYYGVKVGTDTLLDTKYFGSEPYLVEIGSNVQITRDVRFLTHGASWVFRKINPKFDYFGKIVVGDNVYIGNCSLIMPGVRIGDNVIVGAGSVVTKSLGDNVVIAGNPARVIGNTNDLYDKLKPFNINTYGFSAERKKEYLLTLNNSYFIEK